LVKIESKKENRGKAKPGNPKRRKASGAFRLFWAVPAALAGAAAFFLYGPFEQFRLLWINTALYSSRHQFLATSLFTPGYIASVREQNQGGLAGKTNPEPLAPQGGEAVLFAEIKGNHYRGYLLKIDDPARLSLAASPLPEGSLLEQLVAGQGAAGGINGAGFADHKNRGKPAGMLILNGRIVNPCSSGTKHVMGGFREDHKLVAGAFTEAEAAAQGYLWAFEFGPLLILNGEKTKLSAFSGGLAPRTAIGQRADGSVLLLVIDGRQINSIGATYQDVQTVLFANGAVNAIGLDGGSSSSLVYEGRLINSPSGGEDERRLPNAIVFK
jgi:exopolysaccharide biosynthesis protein